MAIESYEIDANGDVLLVLRNPRPPFALWDPNHLSISRDISGPDLVDEVFALSKKDITSRSNRLLRDDSDTENLVPVLESEPEIPPEPIDNTPEPLDSLPESLDTRPQAIDDLPEYGRTSPELLEDCSRPESSSGVKIRVSSRHLILASRYFSNMFESEWKEGKTLRAAKFIKMEVEDVDPDALVIVMNIIHGKTRSVPKTVDLEMLAKIAVIVDLYECAEAAEVFTDMWLPRLSSALPSEYSRDTVLRLCVSWVFRRSDEFRFATSAALKHSRGPIQDMGLPILQSIVDDIARRRQKSIEKILTALRELANDLIYDLHGCSFHCRCILLGALMKAIGTRSLPFSQAANPFIGFSFAEVADIARHIQSPPTSCQSQSQRRKLNSYSLVSNDCTLKSYIDPVLNKLDKCNDGLLLEDFSSVS